MKDDARFGLRIIENQYSGRLKAFLEYGEHYLIAIANGVSMRNAKFTIHT
jgi:hypothetical protein